MNQQGRGVVITGAAGDLGRALCKGFLEDGFTVYAADVAPLAAAERIVPMPVDVTDRAQVLELARRASNESHLEAWVNAAGIFTACPVVGADETEWQRILAVNLTGTWHGCAAALGILAQGGGGRIVNVGSISGQVGGVGAHPAYGASKAGVHALTKTYALEGARHGVLCNAVAPGLIEGSMSGEFNERQRDRMTRANPLRRLARMDEIARVIRFLAGASNTYMNGAIVPVNGGAYMPA
ncbi:MAG: SDR family oxidoreductase [Burkholderiaceae bacterium]|nr:SDR family oxidoreductase [Burkholderiaceae bacterium]